MMTEIGKRYKHYKNAKEYVVISIGYYTESEPMIECVVYQAQYDTKDLGQTPVFIRPRKMFEEIIDVNGIMMDRFKLVG